MPYPANKGLFIRDGTAWTPWTHELVGTGAALFRHGMVSVNGAALVPVTLVPGTSVPVPSFFSRAEH